MAAMVGQDVYGTRQAPRPVLLLSTLGGSSTLGQGQKAGPWERGHNMHRDFCGLSSKCLRKQEVSLWMHVAQFNFECGQSIPS